MLGLCVTRLTVSLTRDNCGGLSLPPFCMPTLDTLWYGWVFLPKVYFVIFFLKGLKITKTFLQVNCYSLNSVGPTVESFSGPRRYLAVYFVSAIASNGLNSFYKKSKNHNCLHLSILIL